MPEFEDEDGNIWFSSESQGIFKYDGAEWWNNDKTGSLKHHVVFSLIDMENEKVWIGTNKGLERVEKSKIDWTKL